MSRRGFTLLELVIVVGLIVALSALVFTDMGERLESARFEASVRSLESALVMARSDAQREGRAFAVSTRPVAERVGVFVGPFDPSILEDAEAAPGGSTARPRVLLAERIRVVDRMPQVESASWPKDRDRPETADELWEAAARAPSAVDAGGGALVVAVFLPDGTAWSPGQCYLVSGRGQESLRAVSVTVNRWTGGVVMRPVVLDPDVAAESEAGGDSGGDPGPAQGQPERASSPGGTP